MDFETYGQGSGPGRIGEREADSDYDHQVTTAALGRLVGALGPRPDVPCETQGCGAPSVCIVGIGMWPGRYTAAACETHARLSTDLHPVPAAPGTWVRKH